MHPAMKITSSALNPYLRVPRNVFIPFTFTDLNKGEGVDGALPVVLAEGVFTALEGFFFLSINLIHE